MIDRQSNSKIINSFIFIFSNPLLYRSMKLYQMLDNIINIVKP